MRVTMGRSWSRTDGDPAIVHRNRAAQDQLPAEKFDLIATWSAGGTRPIWPRERWGLTQTEIEAFGAIGSKLAVGEDIDSAMDSFHNLVRDRALRMVDEVFLELPEAELFAADKGVARAEPRPEPLIAGALGIEPLEELETKRATSTPGTSDERVERVLRLADEWGSGAALRDFVLRVVRLGLQVRGYQWTVTVTPPQTKALALIALSPKQQERGFTTTWVAPWAFAEHFPDVAAERFDAALGGIRGALLDGRQIEALGDRLEELLRAQPPAVGTVVPESGS